METHIEKKQKSLVLIFVDNSASMQGQVKNNVFLNFQKVVKIIQSKHLEDEILIYTHSNKLSELSDLRFNENNSDFQSLEKVARKLSKKYHLKQIYVFSDFQIHPIEDTFNNPFPFVLIPFGGFFSQEQSDFSIPKSGIISVPKELISFPVSVSASFSEKKWKGKLELFVDNKKVDNKSLSIDHSNPFAEFQFSLKQEKVGKHQIKVKMISKTGVKEKTTDWIIMQNRAKVIGLANAPHPDMGIISRIAKELHIQLDWIYNNTQYDGENILIFGDISIDVKRLVHSNVMLINSTQGNLIPNASHFQWNLWESQIQEMLKTGESSNVDSTVKSGLYQSFLKNNKSNKYYFKDYFLNINEPLVFVCEIADSTNLPLIELYFSKITDAKESSKYSFSPHWGINEFRIDQQEVGDISFKVKNKKTFAELVSGKIRINSVLPESERGLNLANLQYFRMQNNVEIVESDQLKNFSLVDSSDKSVVNETLEFIPLRENQLFWLAILSLILLEYLIRKKIGLV
jgi:hypothetical protein